MRFTEAVRAGFSAVGRSKRLLFCAAASMLVVSLPIGVWAGRQADQLGAHRPDADEIARSLDPDFLADLRQANPSFDADATALAVSILIVAFFLRPFLRGGYAGIAATRRRLTFSHFVRDGGSCYWKFLRVSAMGLVLLGAAGVVVKPLLEKFGDVAEASREESALKWKWVGEATAFALFCLVAMYLDHVRAGIRLRRRPGVLSELGRAALFVGRHPFRTSGLYAIGLALEVAVCLPFLWLLRIADGGHVLTAVVVLLLGQCVVAAREAACLFHLAAAYHLREAEEGPGSLPAAAAPDAGEDVLGERLPWHVS